MQKESKAPETDGGTVVVARALEDGVLKPTVAPAPVVAGIVAGIVAGVTALPGVAV